MVTSEGPDVWWHRKRKVHKKKKNVLRYLPSPVHPVCAPNNKVPTMVLSTSRANGMTDTHKPHCRASDLSQSVERASLSCLELACRCQHTPSFLRPCFARIQYSNAYDAPLLTGNSTDRRVCPIKEGSLYNTMRVNCLASRLRGYLQVRNTTVVYVQRGINGKLGGFFYPTTPAPPWKALSANLCAQSLKKL